ncbi:HPF/RaiA family ribosome-associated protein [Methylocella silvestris]|uniref:DNA-binding protein n=1 Tax=Methylocella silvestris TaxID=199596 RepID=A0A2J7TIJ1_METSI|nr:HPF/RaiA family ribosome-associated protein [Methylocella silvestris]PNG26557.1 DNA-binding protein [Methylocella silvestris]
MDRPLQIVFRDIQHSDALAKLIEDRAQRLESAFSRITGCRVVAGAAHGATNNTIPPLSLCVEVEVPGRPMIVAKAEAKRKGEQAALVNRVFDIAERRLEQLSELAKDNVRRHESAPETGVVARLFREQDHGFIEVRGGPDLYFARSCVMRGDFDALEVGVLVEVTRATGEGPMGPQASAIYVLDQRAPVKGKPAKHRGAEASRPENLNA